MKQHDVIRMATQARLPYEYETGNLQWFDRLEAFAKLVAAHERESWPAEMKAMENQVNILTDELGKAVKSEREACAQIAERLSDIDLEHNFSALIAHNIRARGNQS